MTRMNDVHYGERLGDLFPAFNRIIASMEPDDDGFSIKLTLPPDEARPFVRAMHRAEAELLFEDAEAMRDDEALIDRTTEQRGHDAFLRVIEGFRIESPPSAAPVPPHRPSRRFRR